ncbi:Stp1/IreP family PP2C-type Ser/Thr phosphatase [Peptoniphilus sp.]|jgi:serine/threonine protein phosphatase PrpC|uniref:Stp1/IreP family PP2C-type Ser/Thr phosphatase n=1 Tax=Peptoniphilus sp. TaxID=1971214 RepID=UPI003D8CB96F
MKVVSATNVGNYRKNNEDNYYVDPSNNLFVLADGMGGHLAGETASAMATEIIAENFKKLTKKPNIQDIMDMTNESIKNANLEIFTKSSNDDEYRGMGTTVVMGYILDNTFVYSSVGDSRIYLINDEISQLTNDDSFVNYLMEIGEITEEEAKVHPKKNVLTKALGTSGDVEVIINNLKLKDKDILLLCSDGLTNMVSDKEIYDIVKNNSPEIARDKLIELALNNGGIDNITFILIYNE